jgi:hypothetical protein
MMLGIPLVFGHNLQCEPVRGVATREECHLIHVCKSFKQAGVGTNGILECKFLSETSTVPQPKADRPCQWCMTAMLDDIRQPHGCTGIGMQRAQCRRSGCMPHTGTVPLHLQLPQQLTLHCLCARWFVWLQHQLRALLMFDHSVMIFWMRRWYQRNVGHCCL